MLVPVFASKRKNIYQTQTHGMCIIINSQNYPILSNWFSARPDDNNANI